MPRAAESVSSKKPRPVAWRSAHLARLIDPTAIRKMGSEYAIYLLDAAIGLLPQTKLRELIKGCIRAADLQPDARARRSLLGDVRAFEQASLAGEYYEAFDVNW